MNNSLDLLKRLIAFRPVTAELDNVNNAVDFLRDYLVNRGVYTRIEKLKDRKILYAATVKSKKPDLLFNAHLDVVPAEEKDFHTRVSGGWLWGRGAGDCLGNCAVLSQMLIARRGQGSAGVVFATDEEAGGCTTGLMVKKGYCGRFVIIMDSGGKAYRLAIAQKGILTLKLIASGKASHGSTPWLGCNAIERLMQGYLKIKRLFPVVRPGNEWHTTCSANVINAGNVFNRVPDNAEMVLDIRWTEKTSPAELVRRIRKLSGLKVVIMAKYPAVFLPADNRAVRGFARFMKDSLRHKITIERMNGATDARHFTALKVPIVMIGVPYKNPHAAGERVQIKGLYDYQRMLEKFCAQKGFAHSG